MLEDKVRLEKRDNPIKYYREHYNGVTRGKLSMIDPGLYSRLRKEKLLDSVPKSMGMFGKDPIKYYQEHYNGLTRGELIKENHSLYQRLRKEKLLDSVPLKRR